jgi:hypothetical protein
MSVIFPSSKMRFKSDGDQPKLERGFIGDKLKTSKRVLDSLGGFTRPFFGNYTFSFYSSEC